MYRQNINTYFSEGLYILVLLLDKLVLEIDLDLFILLTVFSMSVLWLDLDLSKDLPCSDLFLLDISTVLLGACDFSVLLTVSIFFFDDIGDLLASLT